MARGTRTVTLVESCTGESDVEIALVVKGVGSEIQTLRKFKWRVEGWRKQEGEGGEGSKQDMGVRHYCTKQEPSQLAAGARTIAIGLEQEGEGDAAQE